MNASGTYVNPTPAVLLMTTTTAPYSVPTTRVVLPPGAPFSYTVPLSPPISFSYTREDCTTDAAGTRLCRARAIVETQTLVYTMSAGPNAASCTNPAVVTPGIDCDWQWTLTVNYSFTVDGTGPYAGVAGGLADYDPPTIAACGTIPDGATWSSTAAGTPTTSACPAGESGTQTCPTTVTSNYTCSDGSSVLTSSSTATGTCTGCTTPATPSCSSTGYPGDLVLVLDESGSVPLGDFESAQGFFESLITGLDLTSTSQVAVILYNYTQVSTGGYTVAYESPVLPGISTSDIESMISGLKDQGGSTDIYTAMITAANLLLSSSMTSTPKTIVLVSDGQHDESGMCCSTTGNLSNNTINSFALLGSAIADEGIRIVTVGVNDGSYCNSDESNPTGPTCNAYYPNSNPATDYPPGRYVLNALTASETGTGNSFIASSYSTLASVETALALSLCTASTPSSPTCNPATVTGGTVGAYPGCAITCNPGYALSTDGKSCVDTYGSTAPAGGSCIPTAADCGNPLQPLGDVYDHPYTWSFWGGASWDQTAPGCISEDGKHSQPCLTCPAGTTKSVTSTTASGAAVVFGCVP